MIKYLLDTNIIIYVIKKKPTTLLNTFNHNALSIATSAITVSELMYGAQKSINVQHNMSIITDFISRLTIIDYDIKCSQYYGKIKAELAQKGQFISENDLHIAASALSNNLIVVTNNEREFNRIPSLIVENWVL